MKQFHRRTLLKSSIPALAVATALGAAAPKGDPEHWSQLTAEQDRRLLEALKALREATGLTMDQWADWLNGLPVPEVERIADNAIKAKSAVISDSPESQMLHHVRELERLMRDTFPDVAWMKGFQFSFVSDELQQSSIWASAISPDYDLLHMRPGIFEGFREQRVSIAKMGDGI